MKQNVNFIVINTNDHHPEVMKEVLAGIEEEGLYCGFSKEIADMDSITLSYKGAKMSSTGVGIGIQGKQVSLSVVNGSSPVLVDIKKMTPRQVGQNAARYIKKKPLIIPR